jgi:hypothetical protein
MILMKPVKSKTPKENALHITVPTSIHPSARREAEEEEKKMCYKVECSKCGKFSWNGCGKHVASVYEGIEKGKHCSCKPWPGVVDAKPEGSTSAAKEGETQTPRWISLSSQVPDGDGLLTSLLHLTSTAADGGLQVKRKLEFDGVEEIAGLAAVGLKELYLPFERIMFFLLLLLPYIDVRVYWFSGFLHKYCTTNKTMLSYSKSMECSKRGDIELEKPCQTFFPVQNKKKLSYGSSIRRCFVVVVVIVVVVVVVVAAAVFTEKLQSGWLAFNLSCKS